MKRFLFALLTIAPILAFAQGRSIPIVMSVYNESTAIPFTRFLTTPIHPGIQIGTEFNYSAKTHGRLYQTANLSYFYHNHLVHGFGINTELGYEYRLAFGLAFTGHFGVGYMHTFSLSEEFTLTDGQYMKASDKGNARLTPAFSLGAGYYLKKSAPDSPMIFLRYQPWVEYPYSPDFIPVMTHINLHLGAKFFVSLDSKKHD